MSKPLRRIYVYEDDFWDLKSEAAKCRANLVDYMSKINPKKKKENNIYEFP